MDDLHFTISFDMWLKLAWVDNRIRLDNLNGSSRAVFPSSISNNPDINTIGLVDMEMLEPDVQKTGILDPEEQFSK